MSNGKFLSALEAEILRITYFEGGSSISKVLKTRSQFFFCEYLYTYCKSYPKYSLKD